MNGFPHPPTLYPFPNQNYLNLRDNLSLYYCTIEYLLFPLTQIDFLYLQQALIFSSYPAFRLVFFPAFLLLIAAV